MNQRINLAFTHVTLHHIVFVSYVLREGRHIILSLDLSLNGRLIWFIDYQKL